MSVSDELGNHEHEMLASICDVQPLWTDGHQPPVSHNGHMQEQTWNNSTTYAPEVVTGDRVQEHDSPLPSAPVTVNRSHIGSGCKSTSDLHLSYTDRADEKQNMCFKW